jgi:hypothetical protein
MGAPESALTERARALYEAARLATLAPSILNTQPWSWRIHHDSLSLHADRTRLVESIDREGRMLTLSCGGALHHAYTAVKAHGLEPAVRRLPDDADPDLLALVTPTGPHQATYADLQLARSIRQRRSDRREIAATSRVSDQVISSLQAVARAAGATMHRITEAQRPFLGMAARHAQEMEGTHAQYQADLAAWTDRRRRGEGVSVETLVATTVRTVPLRDFARGGETAMHPGFGDDRFADFLVVATTGDEPMDWLRAGEAMSAVWLTVTGNDLAASVLSDVIEIPSARALVARLLPDRAWPQLVFRLGRSVQPVPPPASPRRDPHTMITVDDGPD